jgi:hypothetical protein
MIARRTLLRWIGLAAVAPALPAIAAPVEPTPPLSALDAATKRIQELFAGDLTIDVVYIPDGSAYSVPATGHPHGRSVILSFCIPQTGVLKSITARKGSMQLCSYEPEMGQTCVMRGDIASFEAFLT